jgi:hypothetical protein
VEKCAQPVIPACVDRNAYCTAPPDIPAFARRDDLHRPLQDWINVPDTKLRYYCAQVSISSTLNARIFCTNIILAAFSSYIDVEKAAETTVIRKICTYNVDEIDGRTTGLLVTRQIQMQLHFTSPRTLTI